MPSIYSDRYMNNSWLRLPTYRYTRLYSQRKNKRSHRAKSGLSETPSSDEGLKRVKRGCYHGCVGNTALFEGTSIVDPLHRYLRKIDGVLLRRKTFKMLSDAMVEHHYREAGYAVR